MNDTEILKAIEDIRQLRARFARTLDLKQWKELANCFTEDCVFDCTQEAGVDEKWTGREAIIGNIRRSFAPATTVHQPHTAEIQVLGPDSAWALWAMQDLLRFPGMPIITITGWGHYHERYRKEADGQWRVASFRLTRLRTDVARIYPDGQAPQPLPPRQTDPERTIRAVRVHEYGGPDVLKLEIVPQPVPGPGEVLIRVAGAAVNPVDVKGRAGAFGEFLPLHFPAQLGGDVSGVVEAVGPDVTELAVGDRVMGMIDPFNNGAYAEKIIAYAAGLVRVPEAIDLADAAAIPMAALTGSQIIETGLRPKLGDRVLVTGAAGSVGRAAVYAAAASGARVFAGVRHGSEDGIHDLPIAGIVDINDLASVEALAPFDGIADTVGGLTAERLARYAKAGAIMASVVSPPPVPDDDYEVTVVPVLVAFDATRLKAFADEVAAGRQQVLVAARFALADAPRAHALMEAGSLRGKVILNPEL